MKKNKISFFEMLGLGLDPDAEIFTSRRNSSVGIQYIGILTIHFFNNIF